MLLSYKEWKLRRLHEAKKKTPKHMSGGTNWQGSPGNVQQNSNVVGPYSKKE